jgi:putative acetyltransferase
MEYRIRTEEARDRRAVEELTRRAFWNVHVPGCNEHYLVHVMRDHGDFVPELDFVLEADGTIIGNVMYTKARLIDGGGREKPILTFGPVSIAPEHQRQGHGKRLLEHSFGAARALGHTAIVIFGAPGNYVGVGFTSCAKHGIHLANGETPTVMLAKELSDGALGSGPWVYRESEAYAIDEAAAELFERGFQPMEKGWRPSQEEFFILSNSRIRSPQT